MVLLKDKIENKIKNELLIIDPNIISYDKKDELDNIAEEIKEKNLLKLSDQIKPASYNIRVGSNIAIEGGKHIQLKEYETVTIEPFEVAIIETYEKINMPLDLIARWNIRVKLAYKGLIWVGGPQVDPGYSGYLYCPIYNMSDKPVELRFKDSIATIDFEQTTEPTKDFRGFDKSVLPFEFYKSSKLKSALTTHVQDKLKEMDAFKDKMEERLHKLQTTFLTVIGALFATLSILIISIKNKNSNLCTYFVYLAIAISIVSLLMHNKDIVPWYKKIISFIGYIGLIIIIGAAIGGLFIYEYLH